MGKQKCAVSDSRKRRIAFSGQLFVYRNAAEIASVATMHTIINMSVVSNTAESLVSNHVCSLLRLLSSDEVVRSPRLSAGVLPAGAFVLANDLRTISTLRTVHVRSSFI